MVEQGGQAGWCENGNSPLTPSLSTTMAARLGAARRDARRPRDADRHHLQRGHLGVRKGRAVAARLGAARRDARGGRDAGRHHLQRGHLCVCPCESARSRHAALERAAQLVVRKRSKKWECFADSLPLRRISRDERHGGELSAVDTRGKGFLLV